MQGESYPYYLANRPAMPNTDLEVFDKYSGEVATRVAIADASAIEAGKPIRDARGEVGRLIDTFRIASEEATRIYGEVMPLDISGCSRWAAW
jgi:acyl-CoA reductase-like NAD-dependent aldehyde dehydrogenase